MSTDPIVVAEDAVNLLPKLGGLVDPVKAAQTVVVALTGAGLVASKPLKVTGNILIDQLRHDLQKVQADVKRLQNQLGPAASAKDIQYGHALRWESTDDRLMAFYFEHKHSAVGEAQRQYGKRFLP